MGVSYGGYVAAGLARGDVVIVAGRQDRIAGYRDQFTTLGRYPRGCYVLMDEAGHYLPFERPHALGALLQHWLHGQQDAR